MTADRDTAYNEAWSNWTRDQRSTPTAIERPWTIAELQRLIREAKGPVRLAGSGHSFSDIVATDGVLIELKHMDRVLDIDTASSLVKVEGGITLRGLGRYLAEHGLALENLGDIDAQSVAGAISTATHGTGARLRNLSSQVAALELVLADGTILACDESDAETYRAARVGLGALGAIATVTLRCVPAFTLRGIDRPQPLEEVLAGFDQLVAENEHFEFYVFPHCKTALTRANNRTHAPAQPRSRPRAWAEDVLLVNHAFGACCRLGRRFPAQIPKINRIVTRLAGESRRTDRSDRIFASPRLVRFTEMEYALPRAQITGAVRRVLGLIDEQGFAVPFPIEVRTVAADDAMLSTAYERDSGYIAVHMFEGMEWERYFHAVEAVFSDLDGRPHWGKRHFQTVATLRPRYPEWDRFQAVRARLDPEGKFRNEYAQRVLG
jgi:L-gulono-1,4-lactone dehydrogenase